jgi:hypothetical protein
VQDEDFRQTQARVQGKLVNKKKGKGTKRSGGREKKEGEVHS